MQTAQERSTLDQVRIFTSRQLDRITTKRNRRIMQYLHTASRRIIDLLVQEGIGTLILGKNPLWKQRVELERSTIRSLCNSRMPNLLSCSPTKPS